MDKIKLPISCIAAGYVKCDESGKVSLAILNKIRKQFDLSPRSPRSQRLCMAAMEEMFQRFPDVKAAINERTGLIYSSLLGPQGMISKFQDDLLDYPEDQAMAGAFASSVHNAPAGGISVAYGLTGPYFSLTGTEDLFAESLRAAASLLSGKFCDSVLLVIGEEQTALADALRKARPELPQESAAAFFLQSGDGTQFDTCSPVDYLSFAEKILEKYNV